MQFFVKKSIICLIKKLKKNKNSLHSLIYGLKQQIFTSARDTKLRDAH